MAPSLIRKLRAAEYVRMSTDDQDTSPSQQNDEIKRAFGGKYEVVERYCDEGKSASKNNRKRTDFARMLADAQRGKFDVILCYDLSRFSRQDAIEGAAAKKILRDCHIRLITVVEGEIDWTSSTGRIVDSVLTEAQHEYSVKIARNTLRGKLDRAKKGKVYGQTTPYGLARRITEPNGSTRIISRVERFKRPKDWECEFIPGDEDEQETVKWIFAEYARRDVSGHRLARQLNERGIPSPNGGRWVSQTIHEILRNARYVGDLPLGTNAAGGFFRLDANGDITANASKQMVTNRVAPVITKGTHTGIIDRTLFDEVQAKLHRKRSARGHTPSGKNAPDGYALHGILICGGCEGHLYGKYRRKSSKNREGIRYVCKGAHRGATCSCGQWGVHEREIMPFMLRLLVEQIDGRLLRSAVVPRMTPKADTSALERKLDRLNVEYKAAVGRFLKLPASMSDHVGEMQEQLAKWKSEIDLLTEQLADATTGGVSAQEKHRQWLRWWRDNSKRLTYIATSYFKTNTGRTYSSGVHLEPSAIRELLQSLGVQLTLWWDRDTAKRYKLVRGRLKAGVREELLTPEKLSGGPDAAHFGNNRFEIVWCGFRNGRIAISGWPAGNSPIAL